MENASKALIMAAGVLIGVLILSLAIYLFIDFGTTSAKINSQVAEQQIAQFNSKFAAYEGQDGLTIYDVITVASLANENNIYYEDFDGYEIEVLLVNPTLHPIQENINDTKISLIQADKALINTANLNLPTYKCEILNYHKNGRVHTIKFTKN